MGEEETKKEVKEPVTNGTKSPEKATEPVMETEEVGTGLKETEEDNKEKTVKDTVEKADAEAEEKADVEAKEEADVEAKTKVDKELEAEVEKGAEAEADKEELKVDAMEVDEKKEAEVQKDAKVEEDKGECKADAMEEDKSLDGNEKKEEGKDKVAVEKVDGGVEGDDEKLVEKEEVKESDKGVEEEKEEAKESEKEEEEEEEVEENKKEEQGSVSEKGSKKPSRGKTDGGKSSDQKKRVVEERETRTPAIDRPVRERKSVERLVATIEKDNSKEFHIEKGLGTPLKEIPNVAYKLARKKNEETFKLLHNIFYGRRGKAAQVKQNISRFSGFVWHDNEEKQRLKVKEKFDKLNKEKLQEFCDVLDIPITKTTSKKEDIVTKLLDFLVAPHAMTTVLLEEQDQGKKRKRPSTKASPKSTSSKGSTKRHKKGDTSKEVTKASSLTDEEAAEEDDNEEEEKENGTAERTEDEQSESEEKKDEAQDEDEEEAAKEKEKVKVKKAAKSKLEGKRKSPSVASSGKATSKDVITPKKPRSQPKGTPRKLSSSLFKSNEGDDASPKVFSRKKKVEEPKESSAAPMKSTSKEKYRKKAVKGKLKAKETSDDELRNAICDILKEVDFNTATFTDILKLLAKQFSTDLTSRKSSIKLIIQDELTKLADEADDEEEESDDTPVGKSVKA